MSIQYLNADGNPITGDFLYTPATGDPYVVPYGNLAIWDNAELARHGITKTEVPDVPQVISDRQFFQRLANMGVISEDAALAAVQTGTLPTALDHMINQLPSDQRFGARMLLSGATQFERAHPMVDAFGSAFGWSTTQLDYFWIAASEL